jgi:hypothetical protein
MTLRVFGGHAHCRRQITLRQTCPRFFLERKVPRVNYEIHNNNYNAEHFRRDHTLVFLAVFVLYRLLFFGA